MLLIRTIRFRFSERAQGQMRTMSRTSELKVSSTAFDYFLFLALSGCSSLDKYNDDKESPKKVEVPILIRLR